MDGRLTPPSALPLVRYRLTVRMQDALEWPSFPGSLLRSVFGMALRQSSCLTGAPQCAGCPVQRSCPYPALFETPLPAHNSLQPGTNVPNPYVIEPPDIQIRRVPAGGCFQFNIVLFGRALQQLALVRTAFERAVAGGLGRARARGRVEAIELDGPAGWSLLWSVGQSRLQSHPTQLPLPISLAPERLNLRFYSPLRLQHQGRPLAADALSARKLMADLLRRASLLLETHTGVGLPAPYVSTVLAEALQVREVRQFSWVDMPRYSARQQREMNLGGLLGEWQLEGKLQTLFPWLWAGQWLHVGKNATVGHGGYRLS
jgi:CRISPR-associated endoribonuclease Cas6